ncbi:MAG: hypothetical protein ACI4TH_09830, partial [Candidatus Ornithomonoglobus sp.]
MNEIKAEPNKLPLRMPVFNDIMPSLMLILASRAAAMGMLPFGIAFFAASFDKSIAYIGLAAMCIGVITAAGAAAVPKYLIALIAYWLFIKIYKKEDEVVRSIAAGASVLAGGAALLFAGFNGIYDLFLLFTESIISALMYIVFRKSRIIASDFSDRGRMTAEEYISAAITVGVIIAGLNGI